MNQNVTAERTTATRENTKSPIHFIHTPPPGITPPKFFASNQKNQEKLEQFQFQLAQQQQQELVIKSQQLQTNTQQSQLNQYNQLQDTTAVQQNQSTNILHSQQLTLTSQDSNSQDTLYSKRTGMTNKLTLNIQSQQQQQQQQQQQNQQQQQQQQAILNNINNYAQQMQQPTQQQQSSFSLNMQEFLPSNFPSQLAIQSNFLMTQQIGDMAIVANQAFQKKAQQQQQQQQLQQQMMPSGPPLIIEDNKTRYTGRLKFCDENKNYGFLIQDEGQSDIFVHFDDLQKADVSKEFLKTAKQGNVIRFQYCCLNYIGKYKQSRKAVDIELLTNTQTQQ